MRITSKHFLILNLIIALSFNFNFDTKANDWGYLYEYSDKILIVNEKDEVYQNPFAGGLLKPQFSNIDLTLNGINDLLIFDKSDGKVLPFVNNGDPHNPQYYYAPEFADRFPELRNFVLLYDFNHNGLYDIFTYAPPGNSGIRVYENVSSDGELKFSLYSEKLLYEGKNNPINIYLPSTDIPVIADISGDGALDILTFGPMGGTLEYHQNVSFERFGHYDTLIFEKVDICWGRFRESFISNEIELGYSFEWCDLKGKNNKKHSGATTLAIDMNGDGAKDLILGDVEFSNLKLLINGKNSVFSEPYKRDTMIEVILNFPESHPVDLPNMPAAYFVDVNNNNIRDLIVSPNDLDELKTTNQVWLYRNKGADNKPDFEFVQDDFIQESMIDLGVFTAPAFFDYNGNGLMDMVVATAQDTLGNSYFGDRLILYENIGTIDSAVFKLKYKNFLNLYEKTWIGLAPTFGDLTGNGATDLLLGTSNGNLVLYKNTANKGEKVKFELENENFAGINVGQYSAPIIYDYDGDGISDLIIGAYGGTLHYYRNTGTAEVPVFELITDTLGKIIVNGTYTQIIYDQNWNPVDTVEKYYTVGFSAPAIADLNNNGKKELIVGSLSKGLLVYELGSDPFEAFTPLNELFYSRLDQTGTNKIHADIVKPAIVYLDNEEIPYIIAGNYRGGILLFTAIDHGDPVYGVKEVKKISKKEFFKIYPNPSDGNVKIELASNGNNGNYHFNIFDITGKLILKSSTDLNYGNVSEINLAEIKSGIYLFSIYNIENAIFETKKLKIIK